MKLDLTNFNENALKNEPRVSLHFKSLITVCRNPIFLYGK